MDIRLRPARPADQAVLEAWDREPHVIASSGNDALDVETDPWDWAIELAREPAWREQLIAEADGCAIGMVQIIDPAEEESRYWGEDCPANLRAIDIWIGPADALGRGYGAQMMRLALERCFTEPNVEAVLIDPLASNVRAHAFYARCGFETLGPRRFDQDDCLVMRIDRARWNALRGVQR